MSNYKRQFEYFPIGEIPAYNLEILEQLTGTSNTRDTFYMVKYLCCGKITKVSHHNLRKRMRFYPEGSLTCMNCTRALTIARLIRDKEIVRQVREVYVPKLEPLGLISAADAWPVPKMLSKL